MSEDQANVGCGIDIGGSGIKGAIVNLDTGERIGERKKILTPQPATPDAVAKVVGEIVDYLEWDGPVGITVPGVVKGQVMQTASNIDKQWIGADCPKVFATYLGDRELTFLNDADAAGIAEVAFGPEEARTGSAMLLTFGTGIGSAMLINGSLYPNSELGHLPYGATTAEKWASSAVRDNEDLSYKEWATRVNGVMRAYEALFSPQTFIVGGGISRKAEKWVPYLNLEAKVIPAKLRNEAGIVGAALAARTGMRP